MTLIIVKTWSRLLISNYAWHLPGCFGLPFSCLLLGRVIEDRCLPLPGKGGAWHTGGGWLACSILCAETCCFPKRRNRRVFPSKWADPREGHRTGCSLPNTPASTVASFSITTSALQRRNLSLEQLTGTETSWNATCISLIGDLGAEALGKKARKSHVTSTLPFLPLHLHSYLDQDGASAGLGIGN